VLLDGTQTPVERYSDDDISLFEARWWRACDGQIMRPAVKRVLDPRAPTLHRLQMAVLALIVADNQHRRIDAQRIADVVECLESRTPREDIEKLKARVIYHTAFGSLDQALLDGTRLVEAERRGRNPTGMLRALRWVSVPLRRTNDMYGAVSVLKDAYQHASRLGLTGEMWNAAFYLENVALDCENLDLALEWAPVVICLDADATVTGLRGSGHFYTRARIEFMRGDYTRARDYLEQSQNLKQSTPAGRGEQSILALDVLLRVRTGERRIPRQTLRRLIHLYMKTRDSGVCDFETAAVVAGLLYVGRADEARSIYEYYMSIRRSRITNHGTLESVHHVISR
jgi:tetratricopeptide (TPR) repeat protein